MHIYIINFNLHIMFIELSIHGEHYNHELTVYGDGDYYIIILSR